MLRNKAEWPMMTVQLPAKAKSCRSEAPSNLQEESSRQQEYDRQCDLRFAQKTSVREEIGERKE